MALDGPPSETSRTSPQSASFLLFLFPKLIFQQALRRTRRLKLLEGPFESDRAEITQASSFFGSVFFQLCPQSWADPHRVEKPWVANQGVLKSKELTSALPCLTLSDFHEISRAAGPNGHLPGFSTHPSQPYLHLWYCLTQLWPAWRRASGDGKKKLCWPELRPDPRVRLW